MWLKKIIINFIQKSNMTEITANGDIESILSEIQNTSDKQTIEEMSPNVESWVSSNGKDFFFSFL